MPSFLFHLLAPGEKVPAPGTLYSLDAEGLSWGWAFFAFVVLAGVTVWGYRRFALEIPWYARWGLITLRSILFALLLVLLVRPILLITLDESTRRPLLVLLDSSQSMGLVDNRNNPDDLARAALALGQINPAGGLKQPVPAGQAGTAIISRRKLLEGLAANAKLNLWPRLHAHADLHFFSFGRKMVAAGELNPSEGNKLTSGESAAFFHAYHYDENQTAIGDSLRDLLDAQRGEPMAGILLITDGANNSGSSPVEAAAIAKQDGVPLFIYGIGVTSPQDIMVSMLDAPPVSNVKEKLNVTVHLRAQGMTGRQTTIQLKADGKIVDEQPLIFRADGDQEIKMSYTPDAVGLVKLEANVPPLPEESVKDNNSAAAQVRIEDDKIKVLLVEEEPSWEFQYLLLTLQRDRRIRLKSVLIKGDPGLSAQADSPFLDKIPDDKETLYAYDLVIIGDVDPQDLGGSRMKMLNDWVNNQGGGLLFIAGTDFDPNTYRGTPLDPMLPVQTNDRGSTSYDNPVQLKLTPAGELSPLLNLSADPQENTTIWNGFPGVRWTAWVGQARPGAQVLLTDPTAARSVQGGPMPVIAEQDYGRGKTLFMGLREAYRWRSHEGEKYYVQIFGQIVQALTEAHRAGSSSLVQLTTDRGTYLTGDKVKISGRIFQSGFVPLTDSEVPGVLTFTPAAKPNQPPPEPQTRPLRLQEVADHPGQYAVETTATDAGSYSFSTTRAPKVALKFEADEPRMELSDIAMNEKLLRSMATASGGTFLREENLNGLPELVTSKSAESYVFKKIPLAFAPILLVLLILTGCAEWLWRRRLELK